MGILIADYQQDERPRNIAKFMEKLVEVEFKSDTHDQLLKWKKLSDEWPPCLIAIIEEGLKKHFGLKDVELLATLDYDGPCPQGGGIAPVVGISSSVVWAFAKGTLDDAATDIF